MLALDADTGKMKWHFQYTPHDVHDWDANQIQVLADLTIDGRPRKTLVTANRNAFYYVLDRVTGEFLHAAPYAKQTWAKGIDAKGRPRVVEGSEPTYEGNLVYPSLQGSTNWPSPSFSPQTGLFYVPVREMGSYYYKTDVEYEAGQPFTGGGERRLADEAWGAVRALDAETGAKVWDFRLPSPSWSGVLSTAGGLVFSGSNEGNFYALDARTGAAAVAVPGRWPGAFESDDVPGRRPAARVGGCRPRRVHLRAAAVAARRRVSSRSSARLRASAPRPPGSRAPCRASSARAGCRGSCRCAPPRGRATG